MKCIAIAFLIANFILNYNLNSVSIIFEDIIYANKNHLKFKHIEGKCINTLSNIKSTCIDVVIDNNWGKLPIVNMEELLYLIKNNFNDEADAKLTIDEKSLIYFCDEVDNIGVVILVNVFTQYSYSLSFIDVRTINIKGKNFNLIVKTLPIHRENSEDSIKLKIHFKKINILNNDFSIDTFGVEELIESEDIK